MSAQAENLVRYMPKQTRDLHERVTSELARGPSKSLAEASSEPAAPDVAKYISRIARAKDLLQASSSRVRELEEALYDLKQQHVIVSADLADSKRRSADLEQHLAAEKNKTVRAETLAAVAVKRAKELDQALVDSSKRLETLTVAIESSFANLSEVPSHTLQAAA